MNLSLLQLGDSALPIGGYSHSWGLEAAVQRGFVNDAPGLEEWVGSWLRCSLAPLEGVVVSAVSRGGKEIAALNARANQLLWVSMAPPTLRQASRDMGEQLLALAQGWPWARDAIQVLRQAGEGVRIGQWHHAPVFATLAASAGATSLEAVTVYLHQAALGMIGAGVRAIPIGHTHGQQLLARLQDTIENLAADMMERPLETAGSNCAAYEILCHEQSQLYTRIFRS